MLLEFPTMSRKSNSDGKESYRVLPKGYSELPESYSEEQKSYSDIYKDRACDITITDLNTDSKQTGTDQERPAPNFEIPVKADVIEEEINPLPVNPNSSNLVKLDSAKLSPEEKLQDLITKFENGEISVLPADELRLLANHFIGDLAKQYRKSGRILNPSPNDLDTGFKAFIMQRDEKVDPSYASRLITKIERDPARWAELSDLVAAWTLEKSGQGQEYRSQAKQSFRRENGLNHLTLALLDGL